MKISFSSRLWLAWQVLRGLILSYESRWQDYDGSTFTITLAGRDNRITRERSGRAS
jgi:hypothetical protein